MRDIDLDEYSEIGKEKVKPLSGFLGHGKRGVGFAPFATDG